MHTEDAEGCVLGHTLRLPSGVLKKGRPLSRQDVMLIQAAGHSTVIVARLGADDVREDQAALRLAESVVGAHVECEGPFTGRANLRASVPGLLEVATDSVNALLRIDEALTLATLPPGSTVWTGQLLATAKVIPFAVPETVVRRWEKRARSGPDCLTVRPFQPHAVAHLQTRLDGTRDSVLDRASATMRTRVSARGSEVTREMRCAHEQTEIKQGIIAAIEGGVSVVVVLGASQIADRDDVLPRAVVEAGGVVHRLGVPVDPGNLTMIASVGEVTVLGVPGCARSARPSGFDWVLDRVLTGAQPAEIDATLMGVGGLLKEIKARPQPRDGPPRPLAPGL